MKKGKFKYYAASGKKMAISSIYIYPDFRRKAQMPDLAVVRLSAESITDDLNRKYLTFGNSFKNLLWNNPEFYPQDNIGENLYVQIIYENVPTGTKLSCSHATFTKKMYRGLFKSILK